MQEIVGQSLGKRLTQWGVDRVFGPTGHAINGLNHEAATLATVVRDKISELPA